MRGEKIRKLTTCTRKFPDTVAKRSRSIFVKYAFLKVPRRFKCPAPSTWFAAFFRKRLCYVLCFDSLYFCRNHSHSWKCLACFHAGRGWLGCSGVAASGEAQCTGYSHRRRYSVNTRDQLMRYC